MNECEQLYLTSEIVSSTGVFVFNLLYLSAALIEERGDGPLRVLLEHLGGWPVLNNNWSDADFDLIDLAAKLRLYNNRILINQWVSSDDKDSSINVIQVCS